MNLENSEIQKFRSNFAGRLLSVRVPWMFDRRNAKHVVISGSSKTIVDVIPKVSGIIAQILATYPPGMARFLLIDPVGLGQNFSFFHSLADHDEKLITNRVWSDRRHIRERLEDLIEHIETVVQKYLRSDFESIDQYNEQAGEIAEPYRFVFIYNFPESFDSEACLALERIMANGPRCGVYVVMVWDESKDPPHGVNIKQIIQRADHYKFNRNGLKLLDLKSKKGVSVQFDFDTPANADIISEVVKHYGQKAEENSVVEVPYNNLMNRIMAAEEGVFKNTHGRWSLDSSQDLVAPLGPTGARKIQPLSFGVEGSTAHHALLIGRTGSGKSNLLHVLIVSLAELYSPKELEIYLVDFKKGVEFKDYATHKLPPARVVAIESELEFGVSVLRGMDVEMDRRGNVFRDAGVQSIGNYREKTGDTMPRTLLIVDEFHELFVEEGPDSQEALRIVERIARQGRSFGMHMVLASQSISGIRLPRSILDQIGVRIALQCSEADSRTVLADDNGAARLLNRAGEAIYNDQNGLVEGNNPFQTALLDKDERNRCLSIIRQDTDKVYSDDPTLSERFGGPFVFEGSEPSDFTMCRPFNEALGKVPQTINNAMLNLWVGEPIAMAPPHAINLKRQSGANLMVIDRNEELSFGVVFSSVLSIAAQENPESVVFHVIDMSSADAAWADHFKSFVDNFPHHINVHGRRGIDTVIPEIAEEIDYRDLGDTKQMSKIILVLFGVQRARNLRREDTFSFSQNTDDGNIHDNIGKILREGPEFGIHTIIWCDTFQSLSRIFDNYALNEIGHRISGTLSPNDSIKLFDETVASNIERENRMICYDDEKVGVYTTTRPYRPCDLNYLEELGAIQTDNQNK